MRKTIGIVGGLSPASTAEYYTAITSQYYTLCGDNDYPRIIIDSISLQQMKGLLDAGRMKEFTAYLKQSVNALERAGADFVLISSNTPHCVFDELQNAVHLPLLSIVAPVVEEARRLGLCKLLLLGTRSTMQASFYQNGFEGTSIQIVVPDLVQQDDVDGIIFGELVADRFLEPSRRRVLDIIASNACDGVILGCTELPLLIRRDDCPLPLLDTLALHAGAALRLALGGMR